MICPKCGNGRAVVKDTRDVKPGEVKRFRKCDVCGYMFYTREIAENIYCNSLRALRKYSGEDD